MVPLKKAETIIDVCPTCRGIWFDPGEMSLLKEEDFQGKGTPPEDGDDDPAPLILRSKKGLFCPLCESHLTPVDYQYTGSAVYHCRECRGTFSPRKSARNIHRHLVEGREKAEKLLRKSDAIREEASTGRAFSGLSRKGDEHPFFLPIPALIPVESEVKLGIIPYVTLSIIGIFLLFFIAGKAFFVSSLEVAEGVALVSGTGIGNPIGILGYGLFHTHVLPLIVNSAFLFIAGSPLEERLSPAKFVLLFFAGLVSCGLTHMIAGPPGGKILGAAGGTSAILGGYVVLFPLMKVRVFAMGYLLSLPSYLMVIAWLIISFFMTGDFISAYLNPYGPGFIPVAAAFLIGLLITAGLKMAAIE